MPMLRGNPWVLTLVLLLMGIGTVRAQTVIEPGKTGDELLDALKEEYTPRNVLSYRNARRRMFGTIDNVNGRVRLVYTGVEFEHQGQIPNANKVNTEHTWPQSKFRGARSGPRARMKSDLHHLFPVFNRVNGARSNSPFVEIPDNETRKWWAASTHRPTQPPLADIDDFSESTNSRFEPREDHGGNVARAMAYFYMVYRDFPIGEGWFRPQIETLFAWHQQDPADEVERVRTEAIRNVQGNVNPFVLDPTLFARAFIEDGGGSVVPDPDPEPTDADFKQQVLDRIEALETQLNALKAFVEQEGQ